MKINDFPVTLAIDIGKRTQSLTCRVRIVGEDEPDPREVVRDVMRQFAHACNLGMLADVRIDPETTSAAVSETRDDAGTLEFVLALTNVPPSSCRILVGMLRGRVLLDERVTAVEIVSAGVGRAFDDEHKLPLPGLFDRLSFQYVRQDSMRITDRGIKVTATGPLRDETVRRLTDVQLTWQAVAEGGCCPDGVQAVECTMLAAPGIMIAPAVFELKIGAFNNPEICFDYFANAIERVSRTIQPIKVVEVW